MRANLLISLALLWHDLLVVRDVARLAVTIADPLPPLSKHTHIPHPHPGVLAARFAPRALASLKSQNLPSLIVSLGEQGRVLSHPASTLSTSALRGLQLFPLFTGRRALVGGLTGSATREGMLGIWGRLVLTAVPNLFKFLSITASRRRDTRAFFCGVFSPGLFTLGSSYDAARA